jgi:DNA-binding XRE family transcriptional regulator
MQWHPPCSPVLPGRGRGGAGAFPRARGLAGGRDWGPRQQKKLTQEQLAFEAEIDLTYVGGIERGKRNPSLLVMARIADALGVSLTKLINE